MVEPQFCSPHCRHINLNEDLITRPAIWRCMRYPGADLGSMSHPPHMPSYCNYVDLFGCGLAWRNEHEYLTNMDKEVWRQNKGDWA